MAPPTVSARPPATAQRPATIRRRPATARRGGVPPSRIRWDRVGRLALLLVLGVILLLYVSPATHWLEQRRTAAGQREELHSLEREHDRLARRLRELRHPDAIEREARQLGMVRSGERAFVVEPQRGRGR
jgi:cell division protein FtsB